MDELQSDPEARLQALIAAMEKGMRCIDMQIRLLRIAELFFDEVKQKYPDILLHIHTHPEDDRDSCEFVKEYGLCFP
ncbi:hypothetical protein FS837_003558, partial [Tulasnella sp. UAMH 9824]